MSEPHDESEKAPKASRRTAGPPEREAHPLVQDLLLEPSRWQIWPAVAILRWMLRSTPPDPRSIAYRSKPSLHFSTGEIDDVAIVETGIELTLNAPGLAGPGSPLPASYIARIINDQRRGGALMKWLDGPSDRFMQVAELAQAENNVAFSLATGGEFHQLLTLRHLIGNSAPLSADRDAVLSDTWRRAPSGAIGFAAFFIGPVTASNLQQLFKAFTGLPIHTVEFAGAEVLTLRPARLGGSFGAILGKTCRLATAGIEIVIEGESSPDAPRWARERTRRQSLHRLATAYIGSDSPEVRLYLTLDPGNASPAKLDGSAELGGLAVLGQAMSPVRLPLAAP